MPFGVKEVDGRRFDFDAVWTQFLQPTITSAGLVPVRADSTGIGGLILKPLLELVLGADVMIADLTGGNPNVLYELGVRHMARPSGTLLLSATTSRIPFDLHGVLATYYDAESPQAASAMLFEQLSAPRVFERIDSPVYGLIQDVTVALPDLDRRRYQPAPDDMRERLR